MSYDEPLRTVVHPTTGGAHPVKGCGCTPQGGTLSQRLQRFDQQPQQHGP
jgi:hypothetical protein